ncbi:tetratricopeptide repeat protein [Lutibacter sp.]|uniref:tetratricopeptide repeat protein n=1 Tax=Lutibacter sp. TaxID=1925666 RepID=UPI00356758A0
MKNIIYILTFIITTVAIAQTTNNLELEMRKMKQALAYGDKNAAANSMYSIIALEGPTSTFKDSLAYLYFNERNYISCFLVTKDILKSKEDNELLEMNAISLETIGALEAGLESYKNLFAKTNNNYHAYKVAGLQLAMKKYDEALVTIKKAGQLPDDGKATITFQVNKNYNQNVPLKPAISYLQGIIELNLENKAAAKISFEKAISLFPEFALAKSKLTTLEVD